MVSLILLTPIYQKLPYDKAAMPVKRIDAFRIGDLGGERFFSTHTTHAPLPEVIASATTGAVIERTCFPIRKSG